MTMTAFPFNAEYFFNASLQVRKEGVPLAMEQLRFKVQSLNLLHCHSGAQSAFMCHINVEDSHPWDVIFFQTQEWDVSE